MVTVNDETHNWRGKRRKANKAGGALHTPAKWAELLTAATEDTHMRAWAASVIIWDNDGYGVDVSALEALSQPGQYDREQIHRPCSELVAFLHSVGYPNPEARCVLKEDVHADRKKNGRDNTGELGNRRFKADKRRWAPVEHAIGRH